MEFCKWICGAKHFPGESTRTKCCNKGESSFNKLHKMNETIETALKTNKNFKQNVRFYNTSFQMATMGSTMGGNICAQFFPILLQI